MKTVLSIAGSDPSGGAGIQADLKTLTVHGVFGMTAVTALTAQNTTGVQGVLETPPDFLARQLDAVFTDIFPDAVKVGMVASAALIDVIAERLRHYGARRVVVDPVMISTSGSRLLREDAIEALRDRLFPCADLLTPNIPEAEALTGLAARTWEERLRAAEALSCACGCAVLLKGGHARDDADDLLFADGEALRLPGARVDNPNTHGTGCTLSSAIAANLANGWHLADAVRRAKSFVAGALDAGLDLGAGSGPLNHTYAMQSPFAGEAPGQPS